jgi:hypothetical protein
VEDRQETLVLWATVEGDLSVDASFEKGCSSESLLFQLFLLLPAIQRQQIKNFLFLEK